MMQKAIDKLIKLLVTHRYKKDPFYAWSWGIDENDEAESEG